jgi:ABC-2 type transport system permease protein
MGIGHVLTMPLFFASNAIYLTAIMPIWLQRISLFNQLTYVVHALRTLMITGGTTLLGLAQDITVILITIVSLVLMVPVYPRIGI